MSSEFALPRAGVAHEIREFRWTHGKGHIFKDLQDTQNAIQKAHELAGTLSSAKLLEPDRPIFVIARSGGTGLVLAAAEQLPPQTIERIILLSAAVSPKYDLRPALRASRHGIVSFYSPLDQIVLGWGTRRFGTIDRFYGPSAGLKGFIVPTEMSPEDRQLYARLVQLPWHPRMIWEGHLGGHFGTNVPTFLGKEVAPWLK
jgi:hypothetical protein